MHMRLPCEFPQFSFVCCILTLFIAERKSRVTFLCFVFISVSLFSLVLKMNFYFPRSKLFFCATNTKIENNDWWLVGQTNNGNSACACVVDVNVFWAFLFCFAFLPSGWTTWWKKFVLGTLLSRGNDEAKRWGGKDLRDFAERDYE